MTANPRNAFEEDGTPRNPAVFHPFQSQGFPDNDGKMASEPVYVEGPGSVMVRREGVNKPADTPDSELPPEQRSDISYRERWERTNRGDPNLAEEDAAADAALKGSTVPVRRAEWTPDATPAKPEEYEPPGAERYLGVKAGSVDEQEAKAAFEERQENLRQHPVPEEAKHLVAERAPPTIEEAQGNSALPPSEQGHVPENTLDEYKEVYENHPTPDKDDIVLAEGGKPVMTPGNPLPPEGETPPA